jgi:hypothetical protein
MLFEDDEMAQREDNGFVEAGLKIKYQPLVTSLSFTCRG